MYNHLRTRPLLTRSRISSRQDQSGPEGQGYYPLRGHGPAPTSPPGGVLLPMLYEECVLDPWADSGRPDWILRHLRLRMFRL